MTDPMKREIERAIHDAEHPSGMNNIPASPWTSGGLNSTHALRDYFAAKAMQGLLAQSQGTALGSPVGQAAEYAYEMADAMLKAREAE